MFEVQQNDETKKKKESYSIPIDYRKEKISIFKIIAKSSCEKMLSEILENTKIFENIKILKF